MLGQAGRQDVRNLVLRELGSMRLEALEQHHLQAVGQLDGLFRRAEGPASLCASIRRRLRSSGCGRMPPQEGGQDGGNQGCSQAKRPATLTLSHVERTGHRDEPEYPARNRVTRAAHGGGQPIERRHGQTNEQSSEEERCGHDELSTDEAGRWGAEKQRSAREGVRAWRMVEETGFEPA